MTKLIMQSVAFQLFGFFLTKFSHANQQMLSLHLGILVFVKETTLAHFR